jgi:hypothetical protein
MAKGGTVNLDSGTRHRMTFLQHTADTSAHIPVLRTSYPDANIHFVSVVGEAFVGAVFVWPGWYY